MTLLMNSKAHALIVIPARGGSKGIPRKNLRPLNGEPLIRYSIELAKSLDIPKTVVVSSDDDEILSFAKKCHVQVQKRDEVLANDSATLDEVIKRVYDSWVSKTNTFYDLIITLQPTSPLLRRESLLEGIQTMKRSNCDTVLSAVNDTHLTWKVENSSYRKNYEKRVNRQFLPQIFRETGGFVICRPEQLEHNTRIGEKVELCIVSDKEAVDIDTFQDWALCEYFLKRKLIVIRVEGYSQIGLGHVYNTLLIANQILDHQIVFLLSSRSELAANRITKDNYKVIVEEPHNVTDRLLELKPDVVINDILDTEEDYVGLLKSKGITTINFEDIGPGAALADLVINAIYPEGKVMSGHYYGADYFCTRLEFQMSKAHVVKSKPERVLITFGGTDPNNLTELVLSSIYDFCRDSGIVIEVILGLGVSTELDFSSYEGIVLHRNVTNISDYMQKADIVFSSAGRTIYELATIGVPTIVLAQNERELTHFFAYEENGFINLGLGAKIEENEIRETFLKLFNEEELRMEMSKRMKLHDIKGGVKRVIGLINRVIEK